MSKIEWQDIFNLDIPTVDEQHKKLIDIINQLDSYLKIDSELEKSKIDSILTQLLDYTIYHFSQEEQIQDKILYSDMIRHKKIHSNFVNEVNKFLVNYNNNEIIDSNKLMNFLVDWLIHHILNEDAKISIEYKAFNSREQAVN